MTWGICNIEQGILNYEVRQGEGLGGERGDCVVFFEAALDMNRLLWYKVYEDVEIRSTECYERYH